MYITSIKADPTKTMHITSTTNKTMHITSTTNKNNAHNIIDLQIRINS